MKARRALMLAGAAVILVAAWPPRPAPTEGMRQAGPAAPPAPSPSGSSSPALPSESASPAAPGATGLGPGTAIVTVRRDGRAVTLAPEAAAPALEALQNVLTGADALAAPDALTPEADGPRLLANLRLNERLLDITLWAPQTLVIGGRRIGDVSGIVIPFSGAWQDRVIIVREGAVEASQPLLESQDLADLERVVESGGARP